MEEVEKQKKVKDLNLVLWTLITLAVLGMLWQGFLSDVGTAVVLFVYYIGIVTSIVKK